MENNRRTRPTSPTQNGVVSAGAAPAPAPTLWDDRYGSGSFQRLLVLLDRPCISFARIATEFGVSRERVRQWHREHRPGAPTGHQRRERCRKLKARRRLLADDVFGALHRRLSDERREPRFDLLPSSGGFRLGAVRVNGWIVALCDGRTLDDVRRRRPSDVWVINAPDADFFFVWLGGADYLLLPRTVAESVLRGRTLSVANELVAPYCNRLADLEAAKPGWSEA